jgi:hypothetical protein
VEAVRSTSNVTAGWKPNAKCKIKNAKCKIKN